MLIGAKVVITPMINHGARFVRISLKILIMMIATQRKQIKKVI
jgi:hypothetical protein